MGYYDETDSTREKTKERKSLRPIFSSMISGVVGGALVLGVTTYTNQTPDQVSVTNHDKAVETVTQSQSSSSDNTPTQPVSLSTNSIADIVDALSPGIVGITNLQAATSNPFSRSQSDSQSVEAGTGSGFIFKKEGDIEYILTNNHVIEGAQNIEVTLHDGKKVSGELVGADALTDIAVLKIEAQENTVVANLGDSSSLRTGEDVIAIGNPLGEEFSRTVTQGIVSGIDRTIDVTTSEGDWALNVIQTDAAINPGNSGGPLINMNGEVIGINSLKISQSGVEGLGFAIPSNDVLPIAEELMQNGKIQRPFIGVGLVEMNEVPAYFLQENMKLPEEVTEGVIVGNVSPGSPADEAGLVQQDVIVALGGQKVTSSNDLRRILYSETKIGDEVEVTLYRGGEKMTVKITLSNRDATNA
ncbi:S1C family serine protease [Metabacillus sp. HB246100]|uniref:S1C family serine protease n=1 Tax=Bacillus weihaiensis TaxID=1547283 RepID=UPI00235327D0|nr:trypsin-like peptidase domain-containing protein [Bacillus weihaiensis]